MTVLRKRKTRLVLETDATVRYRGKQRPVVIEVGPYFCTARLKGTQARYEMSWMSIFTRAALITVEREREERKAKRKARQR
jgi:hypothetical protein